MQSFNQLFFFFGSVTAQNKVYNRGVSVKLKQFYKFGTFIDKIKNLGPNLKHDIKFGLFMLYFT